MKQRYYFVVIILSALVINIAAMANNSASLKAKEADFNKVMANISLKDAALLSPSSVILDPPAEWGVKGEVVLLGNKYNLITPYNYVEDFGDDQPPLSYIDNVDETNYFKYLPQELAQAPAADVVITDENLFTYVSMLSDTLERNRFALLKIQFEKNANYFQSLYPDLKGEDLFNKIIALHDKELLGDRLPEFATMTHNLMALGNLKNALQAYREAKANYYKDANP
jgi:hypothetical protein